MRKVPGRLVSLISMFMLMSACATELHYIKPDESKIKIEDKDFYPLSTSVELINQQAQKEFNRKRRGWTTHHYIFDLRGLAETFKHVLAGEIVRRGGRVVNSSGKRITFRIKKLDIDYPISGSLTFCTSVDVIFEIQATTNEPFELEGEAEECFMLGDTEDNLAKLINVALGDAVDKLFRHEQIRRYLAY
jgi:hypothetical protein